MHTDSRVMTQKLLILGLVLAACLELSQGKPAPLARIMEEYNEALIQGGKSTPRPKIMEEYVDMLIQGKSTPRPKIMEEDAKLEALHSRRKINYYT